MRLFSRLKIMEDGFNDRCEFWRWSSPSCRNVTLQQVSLPLADITQSYRNSPDRTKEALHKVSVCVRACVCVCTAWQQYDFREYSLCHVYVCVHVCLFVCSDSAVFRQKQPETVWQSGTAANVQNSTVWKGKKWMIKHMRLCVCVLSYQLSYQKPAILWTYMTTKKN